ncbi:uncharacterized protein CANTADRAFT_6935 [Suhomyces tanzawaensis NRRL Y-17324]|uniref:Uncharacterized protein n=1 Tax=Suhomyces tanzawaensis NRRL Y-17324 TaxID=984487 RepID=A0A1E4SGE3_9ASCO|nr:uncharacterized protein CANTADRAFT_6935 [Suhomyces tanzawaensis NRRL Y-17324]ODV78578.1 hypothetical protein CANTADRAFT_6935 [Suhomyces tanzawaensis NRRL Y-17324]
MSTTPSTDHSYLYTKRFIEAQVKVLNRPLKLDSALKNIVANQHEHSPDGETLTEAQLARAIEKINIRLKRHNNNSFTGQIIHRIVQQVLKLEQAKLSQVNDQLIRARTVLQPVLLPEFDLVTNLAQQDSIQQFGDMINELPEAKYLMVSPDVEEDEGSAGSESSEDDNILVQDLQERVEPQPSRRKIRLEQKRQIAQQVKQKIDEEGIPGLLDRYEELRLRLIELHSQLVYKFEKRDYLAGLKQELIGLVDHASDPEDELGVEGLQKNLISTKTSPDGLGSEINRFRILVEKLAYKLNGNSTEVRSVIHQLNQEN